VRYDPVFKLLAGRRPSDDELASPADLSRFENAINILRVAAARKYSSISSWPLSTSARRLTFDIDTFEPEFGLRNWW